jgi:hypothetical protein
MDVSWLGLKRGGCGIGDVLLHCVDGWPAWDKCVYYLSKKESAKTNSARNGQVTNGSAAD